jgi:predicted PurR-regulated permease PerM
LATVVLIVALDWAQPFLVTLLLGILFAYTLNPLVVWLERIRIPRVVGTSMVMLVVICALGFGTYALRGQVQRIIAQMPVAASKLSTGLDKMRSDQLSNMKHVQAAANTIEIATSQANLSAPLKPRTTHVVIDQPAFRLGDALLIGSQGVLAIIGQAAMVFFLVFFFLLGGDMFKRKLVRLAGPTLSRKKITVHILDDINSSIQKYMFMLLVTNVLVGLLTWAALYWIGLENAGAWAVAAGLLHLIPYAGPAFTTVILGAVAYMQFDSFSVGLLAAGVSLAIATFVGTFVATWMTGRFAKMNMAAVFVSLLFWGWLWGVWGVLLGIPIIVIVKVVSQHVEQLHPVAELLGE